METGDHDSLMSAGGHYRSLVEKQEHSLESGEGLAKTGCEGNLASMDSSKDLAALKSFKDKTQLKFNNVRFAYPTRPSKPILDKFKLSIKQGEVSI